MSDNIERLIKNYDMGVWLVDEKKGYTFLQDYEEENIEYGNGIVLPTNKITFERGELLRKIVSLNVNAIEPVVSYLRIEIALHREAMEEFAKEYEVPDSVNRLLESHGIQSKTMSFSEREEVMLHYKYDRLEELHYQIGNSLILNMPFETLQMFSMNEVDLLAKILVAECSAIYEAKSFQLKEGDTYIPEIFLNYELKEKIKSFLCDPSDCDRESIGKLMQEYVRTQTVEMDGKIYQLVNIRSFSELIAFEVRNIVHSSSNFRKLSRCEICGRLINKKQGWSCVKI